MVALSQSHDPFPLTNDCALQASALKKKQEEDHTEKDDGPFIRRGFVCLQKQGRATWVLGKVVFLITAASDYGYVV